MTKFNVSEVDARLIIGYAITKNVTPEDEYKERLNAGKLFVQIKQREKGIIQHG